jgi:hypothetical protein
MYFLLQVFDVNPRHVLKPGFVYAFRQYIVTGSLPAIDARAQAWINKTQQSMAFPGDFTAGHAVRLHASADGSYFGARVVEAGVQPTGNCAGEATATCVGSTVPVRMLYLLDDTMSNLLRYFGVFEGDRECADICNSMRAGGLCRAELVLFHAYRNGRGAQLRLHGNSCSPTVGTFRLLYGK